jgi:predicted dehydrogenase
MSQNNRREFLQTVGGAAAATAALAWAGSGQGADEGSDRLVVGVIGPGGMGSNHLKLLAARKDVRVAYVCEVDSKRLTDAVNLTKELSGAEPKAVKDMRTVLDDKSVDAVWIATPDHWHAPATILACDAGKHVYVEKPCCHNIREGRLMIEAARRNKKVVQVGTQSRSSAHDIEAIQLIRDGAIGEVMSAKAWNSQLRGSIGKQKPSDPPKTLDYDLWLGPAPLHPYQSNLLPGVWRWWRAFGTGDIGNDGVHDLDVAVWGLGVTTHPSTIAGLGGKFLYDDDMQFPDTYTVVYDYPGDGKIGSRKQLIFEQRDWSPYVQEGHENGAAFYGTKGLLILGHGSGYQAFGPKNVLIKEGKGSADLAAHHQNFIDCVRNGKRPNADIEDGHLSATLAHLGNIVCRTGRVLHFDPKTEQITGDEEANKQVKRSYRDGGHWAVPKGV